MVFSVINYLAKRNILHIIDPTQLGKFTLLQEGKNVVVDLFTDPTFMNNTQSTKFKVDTDDSMNKQNSKFRDEDEVAKRKENSAMWLASVLGLTGLQGDYQQLYDTALAKNCVASALCGQMGPIFETHLFKTQQAHSLATEAKVQKLRTSQLSASENLMSSISEVVGKEMSNVVGVAMTSIPPGQQYVEKMNMKHIG